MKASQQLYRKRAYVNAAGLNSACSVLFRVSMEEDLICSCGHRDTPTVGMAPRRNSDDADVSDERAASISRMRDSRACRR